MKIDKGLLRKAVGAVKRWLHTKRGHDIVLYLMCVVVAALFWMFFALDEETERDYDVPVRFDNIPDSVVIVGNLPTSINVVLRGKGTQFFRYELSSVPTIDFDFRQFATNGNVISLSRSKIDSRLRDVFGQSTRIMSVSPDSIRVPYTTGGGFLLPVKVNHKLGVSSNSFVSGPLEPETDSVRVYTANGQEPEMKYVETETIVINNLSDTTLYRVKFKPAAGVKVAPEMINVTIPVENLVSKKRAIPITTQNVPDGVRMIIYPTTVDINYLVPIRLSNTEVPIRATVDYRNVHPDKSNVPIELSGQQGEYRVMSMSQDSVQYVIEQ